MTSTREDFDFSGTEVAGIIFALLLSSLWWPIGFTILAICLSRKSILKLLSNIN